jgi:ribonuclease HI
MKASRSMRVATKRVIIRDSQFLVTRMNMWKEKWKSKGGKRKKDQERENVLKI